MILSFIFPLLARPLPKGRGYARGGEREIFKYSEGKRYNDDLVTAVRLDSP